MNWRKVRRTQRAIEFSERMKRLGVQTRRHGMVPCQAVFSLRQLRLPFPTGRHVGQS